MGRKSCFALDNLWDGLGAIILDNHHLKYLFVESNDVILITTRKPGYDPVFPHKHFSDPENLATPVEPANIEINRDK
jgi:hypothetical protein